MLCASVCSCSHFHCTQNPNCATEDRQPSGEEITSPQLMRVSGSNIAAMGGSVVRGFHFFMVALQNRTVLQVSRRVCGRTYVCMACWSGVTETAVRVSCLLLFIHNLNYTIV